MKKQFFSIVLMLALVIVAGSVMAQSSTEPYLGATYSYRVTGIDGATNLRPAKIHFTTSADAAVTPGATTFLLPTISDNNGAITASLVGDNYTFNLSSGATTLNFDITYGTAAGLTVDATYKIWIEIEDSPTSACTNMMYLNVVPKTNNLDFAITSISEKCPDTTVPNSQQTDAVNDNSTIEYTITRDAGNTAYDWSFELAIDPTSFGSPSDDVSVSYSSGTTGAGFGSPIRVTGVESVTATITIKNNPGVAATNFKATLSNWKQYVNQGSVVNSTFDKTSSNNESTTTLKRIPSIGGFNGL